MSKSPARDVDAAYKAALVDEYESYLRAGRQAAADQVARVLLAEHGYNVRGDGKEETETAVVSPAENAAASEPKETAVEAKPDSTRQAPAAKKAVAVKRTAEKPQAEGK